MTIKTTLANMYLDYANNFLTVAVMAEFYGMSEEQAKALLAIGKELHEDYVKQYKAGVVK